MYTCAQMATALSKKILILYGKETRQLSIHMAKQVHVWIEFQTKYKTLPFLVNINSQCQEISLSSHLFD